MLKTVHYFRSSEPHAPPPLWLTGFEAGRFAAEALALGVSRQLLLKQAAEADGHPVLVLPGLFASDRTTRTLRHFLRDAGYYCSGWRRGVNTGPSQADDLQQDLAELIDGIYQQQGQRPISLVGWSLGGLYARFAAHLMPEKIRQVITLGSPIAGHPKYTNAWRLYEMVSDMSVQAKENRERLALVQKPLPVPCTSVYSKTDSIVAWQISVGAAGRQQQSVHLPVSHVGMAFSPLVYSLLLDRLQQAEDNWQDYEPGKLGSLLVKTH